MEDNFFLATFSASSVLTLGPNSLDHSCPYLRADGRRRELVMVILGASELQGIQTLIPDLLYVV